MWIKSVALLTSLAATASSAQPPPIWSEAPSVADVAAAYPAKARGAGVGGRVSLSCEIDRQDRPRDCAALGEQPSGYGFGFAARKLAEHMRVADAALRGQEVRIPVTFDPAVLKNEGPLVTRPVWSTLPSAADFQASFPKTANGVNEVRVALVCSATSAGLLTGCAVDREEPAGQGYGQGALALAPKFRVGPWSLDGLPTSGARVRVPIRYQLTPAKSE
ncbi:TonB family protein [Phenylobacterium sp.]|uniref:TonB family protein n=1 Tax=Phenylobacterium sp. TaxID=1871053 RepID=UPI00286CDDFA|nr:TonB family protein [Phenylobacterium sp.]